MTSSALARQCAESALDAQQKFWVESAGNEIHLLAMRNPYFLSLTGMLGSKQDQDEQEDTHLQLLTRPALLSWRYDDCAAWLHHRVLNDTIQGSSAPAREPDPESKLERESAEGYELEPEPAESIDSEQEGATEKKAQNYLHPVFKRELIDGEELMMMTRKRLELLIEKGLREVGERAEDDHSHVLSDSQWESFVRLRSAELGRVHGS